MRFLSLSTGLIVAAIAIPALLLLYFLKLRRRERVVSSTLLWKRAVQDLQVNAPFQKLRKNLLLFLQLLILAAAIFGLANPVANFIKKPQRNVVILIDRSGSMKTVEPDGRIRLEHAKDGAMDLADSLPNGSRAMVLSFADRAEVACSFTDDKRRIKRRIEEVEPTDGPSKLGEALQLAVAYSANFAAGAVDKAVRGSMDTAEIDLFSDGRIKDADDQFVTRGKMTFYRVGAASDNAGLVAFDVRRDIERPGEVSIFVQVANFGPEQITSDVSLSLDRKMVSVQSVTLGPAMGTTTRPADLSRPVDMTALPSSRNVIFKMAHTAGGIIRVKLHRPDAWPTDNVVTAPIDPPREIRVLVVSSRSAIRYFLNRAFKVAFQIEDFTMMTPAEYEEAGDSALSIEGRSAFDLVILDKHDTKRLWPGNYVFFGGIPVIDGVARSDDVDDQVFVSWRESHPLLRHVTLDNIFAIKWSRLTLPKHALKLIEGESSAVMALITDPGHRYVISAFDLMESNFIKNPASLIFLQNAMMYLAGGDLTHADRLITPGDTLAIPVPPGAESVRITRPDDSVEDIDVADRTTATFARTGDCGIYKAVFNDADKTTETYAANVLDPTESLIAPNERFTVGAEDVQTVSGEIKTNEPLWPYAVAAAMFVLLLEWWIYNKRVMV